MITHSPPEVKSGPINRAILLPPAMPPPAASTSHHPASQCRPSGGEAIPPRQPMPAKAGEARTHPPSPTHGQCRPTGDEASFAEFRRLSGETNQHHIVIARNSAEFRAFRRGFASPKTHLAQRSVRKPTSPQTGGLECAQRSAGLHRPALRAGRGTLIGIERPSRPFKPA